MTTGISALERARTLNALAEQDGTMKRLPDLMRFADEHDLPIMSIESLIRYRTENDVLLERTATTTMRLGDSELTAHVYRTIFQDKFITAVVKGDIEGSKPTVVRFVKGPRDRDLLSSAIVPGNVVHRSLQIIADADQGVSIYWPVGKCRSLAFLVSVSQSKPSLRKHRSRLPWISSKLPQRPQGSSFKTRYQRSSRKQSASL
jgi:hypothetical protein